MILHELYFASLGIPSWSRAALSRTIDYDSGKQARWQSEFGNTGTAPAMTRAGRPPLIARAI